MTDLQHHHRAAGSLRSLVAQEVLGVIPALKDDLTTHPVGAEPTLDFLQRLAQGDTPEEALTFAAHCLMPRYAVWWAHECLKARSDLLGSADQAMLALAATWVAQVDEESRYAAMDQAVAAERGPGAWVALAAGWSGGSLTPPEYPPAPVPIFAVGRAAMTGVLMFLARVDLPQRRRWLAHFVGMAVSLGRQG